MATSAANSSCNKKTTVVRVGNYELHKTLGKGNFAIVKLASNIITNSNVSKIFLLSVSRFFVSAVWAPIKVKQGKIDKCLNQHHIYKSRDNSN